MYKNNQLSKQTRCLICNENIYKQISLITLINPQCICSKCIKGFKIINQHSHISSYPLWILYEYNDFFKTLLYRYKGLYDYPLSCIFFLIFKERIIHYYKDYIIVVAPSSQEDNLKRGFCPMFEIAKILHLEIFDGIYKKHHYKQSDLSFYQRKEVYKKLGIKDGEKLRGKKVLILDDVMTSGSTIKACISLVETYKPECIEALALSRVNHEIP